MISPAQRELRRKHIGASDAAAIMGLDPFRSREDVWAEKVLGLDEDKHSAAIELGNELEPVIVAWAGARIRDELEPGVPFDGRAVDVHTANPQFLHADGVMLAHPDAVVVHGAEGWKAPIEAKYRSRGAEWGDDEAPAVPIEVVVQATHQMMCMGASFCWVAAYLAERYGITKRLVRMEMDPDTQKLVYEELHNFWERWVVTRRQPPPSARGPSLEVMKRLRAVPGTVVKVGEDVMLDFVHARDARLAAQKAEDRAKASLLLAMQGADAAECAGFTAIQKEVKRRGYVVEASTYRQLTVKQEK